MPLLKAMLGAYKTRPNSAHDEAGDASTAALAPDGSKTRCQSNAPTRRRTVLSFPTDCIAPEGGPRGNRRCIGERHRSRCRAEGLVGLSAASSSPASSSGVVANGTCWRPLSDRNMSLTRVPASGQTPARSFLKKGFDIFGQCNGHGGSLAEVPPRVNPRRLKARRRAHDPSSSPASTVRCPPKKRRSRPL